MQMSSCGDESALRLDCGDLLYNCVSLLKIISLSLMSKFYGMVKMLKNGD